MKSVRGITFDAGGTLVYPYPSVGAVYSEVMATHGLLLEPQALEDGFRKAWQQAHRTPRVGISNEGERAWWRALVKQTLDGLAEPKDFESMFESLWHAFAEPNRWKLHEGACETLRALKKRGYRLAVLSNWDPRLRILLDGLNLTDYFDEIIISSEVGSEKPDEKIFRFTEGKMCLKPNELLHVGDSEHHDISGAKGAGWRSVLVTHQTERTSVDGEISRLLELTNLLESR
jgi:putative hydrolase of the HAD superfamily